MSIAPTASRPISEHDLPPLGNDTRAAARGGTSLLLLQTFGRLCSLAFVAIATRHLGPGEFGRYSTVASIVLFANFLGDFGTSPAITRLVSRRPSAADDLLSGTLSASLLLGVIVYAMVLGFAVLAYQPPTVVDVALGGLAVPTAAVLSSVLAALDGVGLIARRSVLTAFQTVVISLGAVPVMIGGSVRAAIICIALAPGVVLVPAILTARRAGVWTSGVTFHVERVKQLLRAALPFALSGGLTALTMRFDVILLSVLTNRAETATYDLALRVIEAITYVGTAVCGPLLFILNRRLAEDDRDGAIRAYAEGMRLLYLIGLPLSAGIVILAVPIASIGFGSGFGDVSLPLAVLGGGAWLTFVIFVQGALVMSGESVGRGVAVGVLNTAVTVGLDIALVPSHGALGAALAMVASWAFAVVALDVFHRRTSGIATPWPSLHMLTATAMAATVVMLLRSSPLVVPVLAGAVSYGAAILATGTVSERDFRRLRLVFRRSES